MVSVTEKEVRVKLQVLDVPLIINKLFQILAEINLLAFRGNVFESNDFR